MTSDRMLVGTALVVAAVLGLATAISPMLGLAALVLIAAAVWGLRDPAVGAAALIASASFEVVRFGGLPGALSSPVRLAGIMLIVLAVMTLARERTRRTQHRDVGGTRGGTSALSVTPRLALALFAYVLLAAASVAWAPEMASWSRLMRELMTSVLAWVSIGLVVVSMRQMRIALWAPLVAGAASALWGFMSGVTVGGTRVAGGLLDPNEQALALVVAVGLGVGARAATQSAVGRRFAEICIAMCAIGVVTTQSRGGLLGLVACLFVLAATAHGDALRKGLGALLIGCAVAGALFITPAGQQLLERFDDASGSGRADLWRVAVNEFQAHPVAGVGLGQFTVVSQQFLAGNVGSSASFTRDKLTVHSVPLETLAELGILGATLFGGFVIGSVVSANASRRRARDNGSAVHEAAARGVLAALSGACVCGIFLSAGYHVHLWYVLALVPPLALLTRDAAGSHVLFHANIATLRRRPAHDVSAAASQRGSA